MMAYDADMADVVVIGAGAAGLVTALTLADAGRDVTVLCETRLGGDCASLFSQGGLAAAVGDDDSVDSHIDDTLQAAAGTADPRVVRALVGAAPAAADYLTHIGVRFARDDNGYTLNREACHTRRRVLKAAASDGFGRELMRALVTAVTAYRRITVRDNIVAERLHVSNACVTGAVCRDIVTGNVFVLTASATVMATGGLGGLYAVTTNPVGAVGRGLALAARAGAVMADMAFVQFHPTALDIGLDPAPLATEALRGDGAVLRNSRGERFMQELHPCAELAPRDVVSRGVFAQIAAGQKVYLDCRDIDVAPFVALRQAAARAGLDPARDLLPVAPAAHYHMGGIAADINGRTSCAGLWAVGECAATGLHGANRLASNSLMEAVVMGQNAGRDIACHTRATWRRPSRVLTPLPPPPRAPVALRDEIRDLMSRSCGVIRTGSALAMLETTLMDYFLRTAATDTKTADMALVALLVVRDAQSRKESRGAHYRSDYPHANAQESARGFMTFKTPRRIRQKEKIA